MIRERRQAMSMIEMVVVLGLSAAIFIGIAAIGSQTFARFSLSQSVSKVNRQTQIGLERWNRIVRQASAVLPTQNGYTTDTATMIVTLPSIDSSSNIVPASIDTIVYRITNGELTETVIPDNDSSRPASDQRMLATGMNSGTFIYYDSTNTPITNNYGTTKRAELQLTAIMSDRQPLVYRAMAVLRNR